MAIGYPQRNGQAIKRGLNWLTKQKDEITERGLKEILPDAMAYAREVHDHAHFGHRILRDSYGWAVVHDGKIVALEVNQGNHGHGEATAQLQEVAKEHPEGWVGLVLASMVGEVEGGRKKHEVFFVEEYELDIMHATVDEIRDFFPAYFKRSK